MTTVDVGFNAGGCLVLVAKLGGKLLRPFGFHQIDGTAAKPSARKTRPNEPGKPLSSLHHCIRFGATGFKIIAIACMRLGHEPSESLHIASLKGVGCSHRALILRNDVPAAS